MRPPLVLVTVTLAGLLACRAPARAPSPRTFETAEAAVRALIAAAREDQPTALLAIFGPEGQELLDTSDPASARRNRSVFTAAAAERWRLLDQGTHAKVLVIGYEDWPFPVPIVKEADGWRFDTAAGREEIIARRIGRNELAAIRACRAYVAAQRRYAQQGHDGKRPGVYAVALRSDPGKQNGLYWPVVRGQARSPLGDLLAAAAQPAASEPDSKPVPFYGYHFRVLTAQGADAPGGAKNYFVNGELSGGFALVAWPARYDVTGIMTFLVNHDGVVLEKDFGAETASLAPAITVYNPDASWSAAR